MAVEIYTQLPPDSTSNKNKVRVLEFVPPDYIAGGDGQTQVIQEIVSLATATGELVTGGPQGDAAVDVKVQSEILEELRRITHGIAFMILLLHEGMRPDGQVGALHWADKIVGSNHLGSQ